MKKGKSILLALLVILASVVPYNIVSAESGRDISSQLVDNITLDKVSYNSGESIDIRLDFSDVGKSMDKIANGDRIKLDWEISQPFEIKPVNQITDFVIDGQTVGKMHLDSSGLVIIFNENIEKFDAGTIRGNVSFKANITGGADQSITETGKISSGNKSQTIEIKHEYSEQVGPHGFMYKTGIIDYNNAKELTWVITFNRNQEDLTHSQQLKITDNLINGNQDHEIIPESFSVRLNPSYPGSTQKTTYSAINDATEGEKDFNDFLNEFAGAFVLNENLDGFNLILNGNNVKNNEILLQYKTRIVNPKAENLKNSAVVEHTNYYGEKNSWSDKYMLENQLLQSYIDGAKSNEMLVNKTIKGTDIPVEGVKFELSRIDGQLLQSGNLKDIVETNEHGQILVSQLKAGEYRLVEVETKEWLSLINEEIRFVIEDHADGVVLNIENDYKKINISGTKTWVNDLEAFRPESIIVELYANGSKVAEQEVTSESNWNYEFKDLLEFDEKGNKINYEIKEQNVAGYESKVDGYDITNTLITTSVKVNKEWKNDVESNRPESITVNLLANGEILETKDVTVEDNWETEFTNLPKFDKENKEIAYTISEVPVAGYETQIDGFTIINTFKPTSVSGEKTWVNDLEVFRPESIVVELYANDIFVTKKTVTAEDNWKYTFTDLPEYNNKGEEINYTVKEQAVKGYTSKVKGYDIVNTLKPIKVSGTKTWVDNNSEHRPESITVNLLANGEVLESKEVTAEDNWKYKFENLPQYDGHGNEIVYTVDELDVAGYEVTVDGMNLTNTLVPVTITGEKSWVNDLEVFRPESIVVELYANDKKVAEQVVTNEMNWKYTFTDLVQYDKNGEEINYTVKEQAVKGYTSITDGFDLVNTLTEIVSVNGKKIWQDDNVETSRPDYIEIELYANGVQIDETKVSEESNWEYQFENLHKFDKEGNEISYSIKEKAVNGYTVSYEGNNIINTRNEQFNMTVNKEWIIVDSDAEKVPITVVLSNNAGFEKEVTITEEDNWTYTFENLEMFDENGKKLEYILVEKDLDGFTSEIVKDENGFTVINTANPTEPEVPKENPVEPTEPEEPEVEEVLGVSRDPETPKVTEELPEVEAVLAANRPPVLPQTGMGFSNSVKLGFAMLVSGVLLVLKKKED